MSRGREALPGRRPPRILAFAALGCALALAVASRGFFSEKAIPESLHGTWTTDDPRMTDRYLRLTPGLVVFGLGMGREQVCTVIRVESEEGGEGRTKFTLHYRENDGEERTLDLAFQEGADATIRLVNRPELWRRSGDGVRI